MPSGQFRKYAYAWLTVLFFSGSIVLHWWFGWRVFVAEAVEKGQLPQYGVYLSEMARDTFENWQSEFLQLLWQVVGLAYFLYVGSPSSKENDDRVEAKIDALIRIAAGERADALIDALDDAYLRAGGHAQPHRHAAQITRRFTRP